MSVDKSLPARFAEAVRAVDHDSGSAVVLAVSGGSDSTALMHLAAATCGADRLIVVSIDHGLRAEAKDEIAKVAKQAARLDLPHHVLKWSWDGSGNLQSAARDARRQLLWEFAVEKGAGAIWTGHTQDDQVETFLLRLARGSGVDGLTAMQQTTDLDGVTLARPMLGLGRQELRDWLDGQGIGYSDDPSNDDQRFDRVKARKLLPELASLGLTTERVLQTIDHMQAAQGTLIDAARRFAQAHIEQVSGDLLLSPPVLDIDASDTPRRCLTAALGWMAGQHYRPRFRQLRAAVGQACAGQVVTLGGVLLVPQQDGSVRLIREASATKVLQVSGETDHIVWDNRWRLIGPLKAEMQVRALADDIAQCPNWRDRGLPRRTLMASPAIWDQDRLIAAPLAQKDQDWSVQIVADFHSTAFGIEDQPMTSIL